MVAMCSKGTEISLESVSSASLSYEGDSRPAATSMAAATIFVGSGRPGGGGAGEGSPSTTTANGGVEVGSCGPLLSFPPPLLQTPHLTLVAHGCLPLPPSLPRPHPVPTWDLRRQRVSQRHLLPSPLSMSLHPPPLKNPRSSRQRRHSLPTADP
jgi:hypothetical protein